MKYNRKNKRKIKKIKKILKEINKIDKYINIKIEKTDTDITFLKKIYKESVNHFYIIAKNLEDK